MLLSIAAPVFAESAPVFDADAMQQQDDGYSGDQGQSDVPPPPPPSSASNSANSDSGFVPSQSMAQSSPPSTTSMSMEQRLRRIEQQVGNMQNNESSAKVESLQDQLQSMRGQVEQLSHQLEKVQSQQKTMYADLDKRLSQPFAKANKKAGATVPDAGTTLADNTNASDSATTDTTATKASTKVTATKSSAKATVGADSASDGTKKQDDQPNVAEEQQIYQTAYNLIKAKKYNEAVDALQGMLKKYPSGQFASNAHYWLGELYGLMGKNDLALTEFGTVVATYPDSPRVSDAQLKVGLIYSAQSKWSDAKSSFKKVINHYPGTASARVASDQLKQIKTAGH